MSLRPSRRLEKAARIYERASAEAKEHAARPKFNPPCKTCGATASLHVKIFAVSKWPDDEFYCEGCLPVELR